MAVTGTFQADFTSFYNAVQKAEVSLKSFETGSGKVTTQLDRMANSLSGTKIVQQATIAAEAVERIGGVSKLTVAELQKVSGVAKEAADKLRAMGEEVPAKIQNLADAAKKVNTEFTSLSGGLASVNRLLGAFGAAVSVGAIVNFGKLVFDSASQIHDLALELGISTDALQGFKAAAQASGSDIDAVGKAINKMNDALATGSDSTVAAFKAAGLEIEKVRAMSVEDAFLAITDAIQTIPDPALRAQVRLELFGKAGNALGTAIQEGFRQVAEAADKMSAQTIKDLEAAQDAWEKLGNQVVIISGKMIASTISATREITASWQNFFQFAGNVITVGPGIATAMAAMGDAANQTSTQIDKVAASTGLTITEQNKHAAAAKKASSELKQAQDEFARSLERAIAEAERQADAIDKLEVVTTGLRQAVGGVADGTLEEVRAWLEAQKAVEALYDSIRKLEQIKAGDLDVGKLPSGTVDTETISRLKVVLGLEGADTTLSALNAVSQSLGSLGGVASGAAQAILTMSANVVEGIGRLVEASRNIKATSFDMVSLAIQVGIAIGQLIGRFKDEIVAAFKAIGEAIAAVFKFLWDVISAPFRAIGRFFKWLIPGVSTGGLVAPNGIQHFSAGGPVQPFMGTDSVLAALTPGEIILNAAQQRRIAGAMSSPGETHIHNWAGVIMTPEIWPIVARNIARHQSTNLSQNKASAYTRSRAGLGLRS
jgi:hypothetical protein